MAVIYSFGGRNVRHYDYQKRQGKPTGWVVLKLEGRKAKLKVPVKAWKEQRRRIAAP
jgi:hypothetical protein